ncbi:putative Peptidoglycan domain protein [compost metagenome]
MIAIALFDGAVHHGPGRSVRQLQQALGIMADGVLGSQTLRVLAAKTSRDGGRALLLTLLEVRASFLLNIVRKDPSQWANAHGWNNRLLRLQSYLLCAQFGKVTP